MIIYVVSLPLAIVPIKMRPVRRNLPGGEKKDGELPLHTMETNIPAKAGSDTAIDADLSSPLGRFSNQQRISILLLFIVIITPLPISLFLLYNNNCFGNPG